MCTASQSSRHGWPSGHSPQPLSTSLPEDSREPQPRATLPSSLMSFSILDGKVRKVPQLPLPEKGTDNANRTGYTSPAIDITVPPPHTEHRLTLVNPGPKPSAALSATTAYATVEDYPGPFMPTSRRDTAKPPIFNLAMTHMCCFSHLSQTPRLFFQMGGELQPGRLLRAQQPHGNLAPLTNSSTAPAERPDTTRGSPSLRGSTYSKLLEALA